MALLAKVVFIGMGLYMLIGSISNPNFYMRKNKDEMMAKLIGKTGVRVFYGFMGLLLTAIGISLCFIDDSTLSKLFTSYN